MQRYVWETVGGAIRFRVTPDGGWVNYADAEADAIHNAEMWNTEVDHCKQARETNVRLVAALERIRDECRDVAHVEGIEVAEKRTWISMAAIADAALAEARKEKV